MSLIRPLLNFYLRTIEKRRLAKTAEVAVIRKRFALTARLFFHAPRGTRMAKLTLPDGCDVLEVMPRQTAGDLVIFYIHGGGFVFGSPETHAAMLAQLATRTGARVVMPRYRLAPEFPYPAAIEDVENAYLALIHSGVDAGNIIIGGDSAGGALTFNLLGQIVASHWPMPRGAFSFSPFVDFAHRGASLRENSTREAVLPVERAEQWVQSYLAGADQKNPRISALGANYQGASPVWISVGDTEILRDDARRIQQRLKDQGVAVKFREAHDLPHVWPIFHNILPEARQTLDELASWIKALPRPANES